MCQEGAGGTLHAASPKSALSAMLSQLLMQLNTFVQRAQESGNVSLYAAAQPASLPLVQLFLTLVQLAALQPDEKPESRVVVACQILELAKSIVRVL